MDLPMAHVGSRNQTFAMLTLLGYDSSSMQRGGIMISQERLYSYIGEQLRTHREKRGMTQQELADLVSLERTSITNIERGKQKLPIHVLFCVCDALGVSPSDVMPRIEQVAERPQLQLVSIGNFSDSVPAGIARLMYGEVR